MNSDYNDEGQINQLVDKYISTGEEQYRELLIKSFVPYFKKYVHILCSNKTVDTNNKDTITFLRLFMTEEERNTVSSIAYASKKTIQHLRMIFSDCTKEDIYDEMVLIFLEQLARYKPMIANNTMHKNRISFTHFLQVNSRYRLKNLCVLRGKDALSGYYNIEYNEDTISVDATQDRCDEPINIDYNWIMGITAGDIFSQLEEYERYLLFLKYESDNRKPLSDYELAKITGADRMYMRRKMLSLKEKIKGLVDA